MWKSTLDLGKQHMYRFYFVVKPKYGDNFKMANTDTASFVFRTRIDDIYQRKFSGKLPIYELLGSLTGIVVLAVVVVAVVVLVV